MDRLRTNQPVHKPHQSGFFYHFMGCFLVVVISSQLGQLQGDPVSSFQHYNYYGAWYDFSTYPGHQEPLDLLFLYINIFMAFQGRGATKEGRMKLIQTALRNKSCSNIIVEVIFKPFRKWGTLKHTYCVIHYF